MNGLQRDNGTLFGPLLLFGPEAFPYRQHKAAESMISCRHSISVGVAAIVTEE